MSKNFKPAPVEEDWHTETFEQEFSVRKETRVDHDRDVAEEEEERMFEEWTEVFTALIRGTRYKITWVFDTDANERVSLMEAIKRGIIDPRTNNYRNVKTSHTLTVTEAVDDGLIAWRRTTAPFSSTSMASPTPFTGSGTRSRRNVARQRAIERGVLDLVKLRYRNYANMA